MRYVIIMFITLGLFATVEAQQLHIYKTPDGRTVIGNAPPPVDATDVTTHKPTDPANRSTPPLPITVTEPEPQQAPPPQTVIVREEPEPQPQSRPVNTSQLGLIRPGMSQTEVRKRLGPPEDIIPLGELSVYSRYRSHGYKNTVVRERWVWPAGRGADPASIVFENGRVVAKGRER